MSTFLPRASIYNSLDVDDDADFPSGLEEDIESGPFISDPVGADSIQLTQSQKPAARSLLGLLANPSGRHYHALAATFDEREEDPQGSGNVTEDNDPFTDDDQRMVVGSSSGVNRLRDQDGEEDDEVRGPPRSM